MSWCSSTPASALPTIWGYFPLAAWEAFAAVAVHLSAPPSRPIQLERHKFFRICSYEKRLRKPFAICTYEPLDLKSPGINTYKKIGGWRRGSRPLHQLGAPNAPLRRCEALFPRCAAEQFHARGSMLRVLS